MLKVAESARDQGESEIGDAAHALKSMSRNIGAVRLGAACQILEDEAKSGNIQNLTSQLATLQKELLAVLVKIKDFRGVTKKNSETVILEA